MKANESQNLLEHIIAVANLATKIIDLININENSIIDKESIKKTVFLSALFHDLGKIDPVFQEYLSKKMMNKDQTNGVHIEDDNKKFSFNTYPRHNEISWFILETLFNNKLLKLNKINFRILKNIVLWHHAAPFRKTEFDSQSIASAINSNPEFIKNLKTILNEIAKYAELSFDFDDDDFSDMFISSKVEFPKYKEYFSENKVNFSIENVHQDIINESITSLIKTVLITADRYISASGSNVNIDSIIKNIFEKNKYSKLDSSIEKMENSFFKDSERSLIQKETAKNLSKIKNIAILDAPAGAGKTKVSLQWCKETNAEKIYFIAPRTIICEELYDELTKKYLPNGVSIEVITSDKKCKYFNGKEEDLEENSSYFSSDINITTLDQISKTITTHKSIAILFDLLNSHLVFDEYHEYNKLAGFDLLFAEIITLKKSLSESKTLLMSATPNFLFLETFLKVYNPKSSLKNIITFETTNKMDFKLKIEEYEEVSKYLKEAPIFNSSEGKYSLNKEFVNSDIFKNNHFFKLQNEKIKTIVISNTATLAQMSYLINSNNENSLLAHAKYNKDDKKDVLSSIKINFSDINNNTFPLLRAGPIVQASLNITSNRLITELTNAENTLQRLGRLNRFGEDFVGEFIIAIPKGTMDDVIKGSEVINLLSRNSEKNSTLLWIKFLKQNFMVDNSNEKIFKLKDIYNVYKDYHNSEEAKNILKEELINSLKKSYQNIRFNILNPVEIPCFLNKKNKIKNNKLSKRSLRGQGFLTKMAVYDFSNDEKLNISLDYVSNVNISKELILQYNENYEYVKNTVKLHDFLYEELETPSHIKSILKKAKKENTEKNLKYVIDLARNDDFNIYTSFNIKDLNNINNDSNKENSIIYLRNKKQNIGYIKLKKLI